MGREIGELECGQPPQRTKSFVIHSEKINRLGKVGISRYTSYKDSYYTDILFFIQSRQLGPLIWVRLHSTVEGGGCVLRLLVDRQPVFKPFRKHKT